MALLVIDFQSETNFSFKLSLGFNNSPNNNNNYDNINNNGDLYNYTAFKFRLMIILITFGL